MAAISVLLLTTDTVYCQKISAYLGKRHTNIKVLILNSESGLEEILTQNMCNVILIGDEFSETELNIPTHISYGYLTATETGGRINGKTSFCKYQSGDVIYKKILSLYSEVSASDFSQSNDKQLVYAFVNSSGGAGATTAAAAFCYRAASAGKSVLYINLDKLSDFSQFFSDTSNIGDMSDLIFIIKSNTQRNINLSAKAGSLLKKDFSNVRYIDNCKLPCDLDEVPFEQLAEMFNAMTNAEKFDYVVIDGNIYDEKVWKLIAEASFRIFIVSENSVISNGKLVRLLSSVKAMDARSNQNVSDKILLIFNKNPEQNWQTWSGKKYNGFNTAGSIPRYKDNKPKSIAEAISKLDMWQSIIR